MTNFGKLLNKAKPNYSKKKNIAPEQWVANRATMLQTLIIGAFVAFPHDAFAAGGNVTHS